MCRVYDGLPDDALGPNEQVTYRSSQCSLNDAKGRRPRTAWLVMYDMRVCNALDYIYTLYKYAFNF